MDEILHIHVHSQKTKYEDFLLLVPGITFVLIVLSYVILDGQLSASKTNIAASSTKESQQHVLSETKTSP